MRQATSHWRDLSATGQFAVLAGTLLATLATFCFYKLFLGPDRHLPGPALAKITRLYILWFDLQLRRNQKIAEWHKKHGSIVCYAPGYVSICNPDTMREVYGASGKYDRTPFFNSFVVYGERPSFSTLAHDEHRNKRAVYSAFYNKSAMNSPESESLVKGNAEKMIKQIDNFIASAPSLEGSPVKIDAYPLFNCFAFDTVTQFMFGLDYSANTIEYDNRERKMLVDIKQAQMWGPLKFNFPIFVGIASTLVNILPTYASDFLFPKSFKMSLTSEIELADWSWHLAKAAAGSPSAAQGPTLLARFLASQAKKKQGSHLTDGYIAAELFDNTLAGEETVAVSMVYAVYHLIWNPQWQTLVREELKKLPCVNGFPCFADIDSQVHLEAVVKEVYRLNPVISGRNERLMKEGGRELGGYHVRGGSVVCFSPAAMHRNPDFFECPNDFLPERWLNSTPEETRRMESSYIPFGHGTRMCVGKNLGLMEVKLLTAYLLLKYALEGVPEMGDGVTGPLWQCGSMEAVPVGLKCEVMFKKLDDTFG